MSTPSSRPSGPDAPRVLFIAVLAALMVACGDEETPDATPEPEAEEVLGLRLTTRDGRLSAVIPGSFVVHRLTSSLSAAAADGAGRLYVGRLGDRTVAAALGAHKDDLIGLGAEILEERHFERATRLVSEDGPRSARERRRTWLVDDGAAGVILCEGFFPADDELSWIRLLDAVCLEARATDKARPD
jgi:hypothetical protein